MRRIYLLILLAILVSTFYVQAQNPETIDVKALSEQQILKIAREVKARGLSLDEAALIAQKQGATPEQLEELKKRILELDFTGEKQEEDPLNQKGKKSETNKSKFSEKARIDTLKREKPIFGFNLFNSKNLTFEPPVNIPTPENYLVGVGDELLISVWGASQKTYPLRVETDGAIHVPDLGPVYVVGMEFRKVKEVIVNRLSAIYQGMEAPSPNTFADVAISNLRSIKINVIGEVMTPGTYTLPATASAFNALYLSGGPNENGSFRNIQIIRDNKKIKTIDVYDYLINANTQANIQLRDQDILFIPVYQKRVKAYGAFKRTGYFELTENEKLSDLIRYVGGFGDNGFQSRLSLTRITDKGKKVIDISQSIYDSFVNSNGDSIVAAEIIDRFENRVNISGAVFMPGTYELTEGLNLSGLIKKAQGVKGNYYGNRGIIMRLQENLAPQLLSFNVEDVLSGKSDLPLHREDQVIIQHISNMREKRSIQIFGEVQRPGEYDFADNMTLKDLIFKAGGFNEGASESFIELARRHSYEEANNLSEELVKLYQFNINRDLKLEDKGVLFTLAPFDYIYVRRAPSYHIQRTVYISGEVRYPGAYSIGAKNERISDLIGRAGGLMPNAFVKGASMKRVNVQAQKNLETLFKNAEDTTLIKAEKQLSNNQLELRLEKILQTPGTTFDYVLKDGDQILVPEISQEVRISGEIQNPIGLAYEKGRNLKYYVDRTGGYGEKAKPKKVFVIYSDGTTKVTSSFLWRTYPPIEPGCQIIVPPKPERSKTDNTGKWLAIASTLSALAIAISAISNL